MKPHTIIQTFVSRVRGRLNQHQLLTSTIWAFFGCAAGVLLVALAYILRGYSVPKLWYAAGCLAVLGVAFVIWLLRRQSREGAAQVADDHFGLKDSLTSALEFEEAAAPNEFHQLQAQSTAENVQKLSLGSMRFSWPNRLLAATGALIGVAALSAFKEPSPRIVEKLAVEAETLHKTEEINDYLREAIEELEEEGLTEEEKELLDPNKLKAMLKELDQTKDREAALRQYANLERQLLDAAAKLSQRAEEELMTRAGKDLQESPETSELGKKLETKAYDEAADQLKAMKPGEDQSKRPKLDEMRKELARLKSAAQRMAAARSSKGAGASNGAKQNQGNQAAGQQTDGAQGAAGAANGQGGGKGLNQMLGALENAVNGLDKALRDGEIEERQFGELTDKTLQEIQNLRQLTDEELKELGDKLSRMKTRRDVQGKLKGLCQGLGQCQGYLGNRAAAALSQCLDPGKGGKGAGAASVNNRRDVKVPTLNPGNVTQLRGQKGSGESQTSTEGADSGSGQATREAAEREREFQRQLESFVQREDVPDEVKDGVKAYFEAINLAETEE